jgi:hypothetical protein
MSDANHSVDQDSPKNLVMGFATNQTEASVRIFCQSLRAVYAPAECDIAIITNRFEPYFCEMMKIGVRFESTPNNYSVATSKITKAVNRVLLKAFRLLELCKGRQFIPEIAEAYEVLLETWHHPQLARWFAYRRILSLSRCYKQIFLSDVKDVAFQAPFFGTEQSEKVTLFADGNPFGECFWNDKWYREAFGRKALKRVLGSSPACIGTLIGSQNAIAKVLAEFSATISRAPFGRIEQAIFNHMVYTGSFTAPVEIAPNVSHVVATLSSKSAYESVVIINGELCRAHDSSPVPVIHMYDRWPDVSELCATRHLSNRIAI